MPSLFVIFSAVRALLISSSTFNYKCSSVYKVHNQTMKKPFIKTVKTRCGNMLAKYFVPPLDLPVLCL